MRLYADRHPRPRGVPGALPAPVPGSIPPPTPGREPGSGPSGSIRSRSSMRTPSSGSSRGPSGGSAFSPRFCCSIYTSRSFEFLPLDTGRRGRPDRLHFRAAEGRRERDPRLPSEPLLHRGHRVVTHFVLRGAGSFLPRSERDHHAPRFLPRVGGTDLQDRPVLIVAFARSSPSPISPAPARPRSRGCRSSSASSSPSAPPRPSPTSSPGSMLTYTRAFRVGDRVKIAETSAT